MNIERERAAFEWWASDEGESPRATERIGGCYKLAQIQSYWMAWQARAARRDECEKLVEALEDIAGTHHHSASAGEYFAKVARAALAEARGES